MATFTDLKAEVFLSQLNLTEVSKVNNTNRHAVLKASGPTKKKEVVITNLLKGMKWNMFSTHIKKSHYS